MGLFGGAPKGLSVEELRKQQEEAAREERDKAAASQAAKENQATAQAAKDMSARAAFNDGIVEDSEESRRKFLKKV